MKRMTMKGDATGTQLCKPFDPDGARGVKLDVKDIAVTRDREVQPVIEGGIGNVSREINTTHGLAQFWASIEIDESASGDQPLNQPRLLTGEGEIIIKGKSVTDFMRRHRKL